MPVVIRAKPGTHAQRLLRVRYKHTPPKVGTIFEAKPVIGPNGKVERYAKWERWYVHERRGDLYVLERM